MKVAVVGAGYFANFHLDAWRRMPDVDLVGVCDLDDARCKQAAKEYDTVGFSDPSELLDRAAPDVVDIATPPDSHSALIEQAASAGANVICQKPFCGDLATAKRAVQICADAGVVLAVHENFRFQPWYREIKRQLDRNVLGDLYQATFLLRPGDGQGPSAYLDRQPYFQAMPRFLVHETAIHFIDTFRFLFGEMTRVFADLRRLNPAIAGEDAGLITIQFERGLRGLFDGNRLADHVAQNRRRTMGEMTIEGVSATLRLSGDGDLLLRRHGSNHEQKLAFEWHDRGFGGDCVYALQSHIIEYIQNGGPLENSGAAYLKNLEIEDAVYRSAEQGRWIDLS